MLAETVLFVHLLWCGWVLFAWIVTRCRPLLRTLHIASLVYAIAIELAPWPPCPLTVLERGLRLAQASNRYRDRFWCESLRCRCVSRPARMARRWLCGACLYGDTMCVSATLSSPDCERAVVKESDIHS